MVKTKPLIIRITEEETFLVEEVSIRLFGRLNKSRLIRKLLRDYIGMGPDLIDEEMQAFREVVKQLTGIARNLNQITARINHNEREIEHLSIDYLERLKLYVNNVNEQLKQYISHTITRYQEVVNHDDF